MSFLRQLIEAIFGVGQPISQAELDRILSAKAAKKSQPLNWRESIVDLLKVVDMDSSMDARAQLAKELGDEGEYTGTSEENLALIQRFRKKLADNDGKVPADLR